MSILDFQTLMWLLPKLAADGREYSIRDVRETLTGRRVARL